jgi:cytochrome P450
VIDETLRLYPPVHAFTRQAIGADEISGHQVPAGSFITISSWVLHRHTLHWDEPEVFKPERFLPGAAQKINPHAYIPFGAGARICLGKHLGLLESVLLLAMIAQSFRLRMRPGHPVEPLGRMTLRPRAGLPMRIEPRG